MGVITQVTLRLLPRSDVHTPQLLAFPSTAAALRFAAEIDRAGAKPATITYLSETMLAYLNELHRIDQPQHAGPYLAELPSLLIYCDDAESVFLLRSILDRRQDVIEADRERAGYAWADRYFPMKIRRLGPALLAAQVVMPIEQVAAYLAEADRYAAQWGLTLATEAHVLPASASSGGLRALTMPMFLTDAGRKSFAAHFAFVPLLERLGAKHHGQPYNLGIWHAPFASEKYSREEWQRLIAAKRRLDPHQLLNPGKFPRVKSRFGGLTGLLLQPPVFKFGMDFFRLITPIIGLFTGGQGRGTNPRVGDKTNERAGVKTPERSGESARDAIRPAQYISRFHVSPIPLRFETPPRAELLRTAQECTSCGNCISVCPAYLHTHDERTTARGKLWLAKRAAAGQIFDQDESDMAFMCLRCRACSEVCQAQLPLMAAWEQLESLLAARHGRPDAKIRQFLADVERNPEYAQFIGLKRPGGILTQTWLNGREIIPLTVRPPATGSSADEDFDEPVHTHPHFDGGKFHIDTRRAAPVAPPVGKFHIERSDFCINCGQCAEACVYGVHYRSPLDLRRMNDPDDYLCRACFRCIEECPRQALSISLDAHYHSFGRGPYTPDIVASLAHQAEEGRIPVTGAGYRGPFAGEGFDGMWTDMSEIVRPTRDGIHGREYISTAIDLGRRPARLIFAPDGVLLSDAPPSIEIPLPIVFQTPPIHRDQSKVARSIRRAARELKTFVIDQTQPADGLIQLDDGPEVLDEIARHKADQPSIVVVVKVPLGCACADRVEELVRSGVEVIHLAARWDGVCEDGSPLYESLPQVHQRLVAANIRDEVTLLAGGGLAAAEHVPKTIILGADGVVIDLPLLAALECPLSEACFEAGTCRAPLDALDVKWGQQRIVNLMASWRNQLLEVLGAMGLREVRRLRGERGRAMFAKDLENKVFKPMFLMSNE